MSAGHVIYHGPTKEAAAYFETLGFRCPERKGLADFLQEVTSPRVGCISIFIQTCLCWCRRIWMRTCVHQLVQAYLRTRFTTGEGAKPTARPTTCEKGNFLSCVWVPLDETLQSLKERHGRSGGQRAFSEVILLPCESRSYNSAVSTQARGVLLLVDLWG